ncbi:MAG: DUF975 family protein [Bacilli bacterium]|nr:DUF975 family protein [Bacilli bacterium]
MRVASDFRASARSALTGKWGLAVVAGIIASVFGVTSGASGTNVSFNFSTEQGPQLEIPEKVLEVILPILAVIILFGLVFAIAFSMVACVISVGYAKFNLDLVDSKEISIKTLFIYFPQIIKIFLANLLVSVYVLLWSLLFIIPGIIASYSYAMVPYILAENPNLSIKMVLAESKRIMKGNRFRLFCLEFSFIGWVLLCILTLGLGFYFLNPYMAAARADFYREVSNSYERKDFSKPDENYSIDFDAILEKRKQQEENYYHFNKYN